MGSAIRDAWSWADLNATWMPRKTAGHRDRTEAYDRGDKLRHCRNLQSLRAYLLLSQYQVLAEHLLRQPDGTWSQSRDQDPSESVPLPVVEAELSLAEVYDQVELSR